jgi:amylosucrase
MDWPRVASLPDDPESPAARVHEGLRAIIAARKRIHAFAAQIRTRILDIGHPALFAFLRADEQTPVTCVFNFTEHDQRVAAWALRLEGVVEDALSDGPLRWEGDTLVMPPYAALWLRRAA